MSEFNSIQLFEKIEGTDASTTLHKFSIVLKTIGIWNKQVQTAFEQFEWKPNDDGYAFTSLGELGWFETNASSTIKVRPLVLPYTTAFESFASNWVGCLLLIRTGDLKNGIDGGYKKGINEFVTMLMISMQKEFPDLPIYFADEAQEGSDFDGIRCNDLEKLWQFDFAIIPSPLYSVYSNQPGWFNVKEVGNYRIVLDSKKWPN